MPTMQEMLAAAQQNKSGGSTGAARGKTVTDPAELKGGTKARFNFRRPTIKPLEVSLPTAEEREEIKQDIVGFREDFGPQVAGYVERLLDALRVPETDEFAPVAKQSVKEIDEWMVEAMKVAPPYLKINQIAAADALVMFVRTNEPKIFREVLRRLLEIVRFLEKDDSGRRGPEHFKCFGVGYALAGELFRDSTAKRIIRALIDKVFELQRNLRDEREEKMDGLFTAAGEEQISLEDLKYGTINGRLLLIVPKHTVWKKDERGKSQARDYRGGRMVVEVRSGRIFLLGATDGLESVGRQIIADGVFVQASQLFAEKIKFDNRVEFSIGFAYIFRNWLQEAINKAEREAEWEAARATYEIQIETEKAALHQRGLLDDAKFWLARRGGTYLLDYRKFGRGPFVLKGGGDKGSDKPIPDLFFLVRRQKKGSVKREFIGVVGYPERLMELLRPFEEMSCTELESYQNSVLATILRIGAGWAKAEAEAGRLALSETLETEATMETVSGDSTLEIASEPAPPAESVTAESE